MQFTITSIHYFPNYYKKSRLQCTTKFKKRLLNDCSIRVIPTRQNWELSSAHSLTLVVVAFHDIAAAAVNGNRLDVVKRSGHNPTQSQIINPMAPDLNPDWTDCSNSGRQAVMSPEILGGNPLLITLM